MSSHLGAHHVRNWMPSHPLLLEVDELACIPTQAEELLFSFEC